MQQARYEFYVIRSNPSHPDTPRLFFVKNLNNKISWSLELDEFEDILIKSEFDQEEAEFWGFLEKIHEDIVTVRLKDNTLEETSFSPNMLWNLQTLMMDGMAILKTQRCAYAARLIPRDKYKNDKKVIQAELEHFKRIGDVSLVQKKKYDVFTDSSENEKVDRRKPRRK